MDIDSNDAPESSEPPKRGRGRPKGSLNKKTLAKQAEMREKNRTNNLD